MLKLLDAHDAAAARDDEPVARLVEGARGRLRRIVVLRGERACSGSGMGSRMGSGLGLR